MENNIHHHTLPTNRLEALSDGIFAFAMTLLVLDLQFPGSAILSKAPLSALLWGQADRFFNYFLSFILLALFWMVHHRTFNHIRGLNVGLLWLNILLLSFIVLIPFSTSLIGNFDKNPLADVVFAGNILIIGVFNVWIWFYATRERRFTSPELEDTAIKQGLARGLVVPLVSLLVIAASFIIPGNSSFLFLLIPLLQNERMLKLIGVN
ncbi:MAG: TMEM175 family protein [Candidatus Margulisiibacteriota bacterium]